MQLKTIKIEDIAAMPVDTQTGEEFGNLVMCTLWLKDGSIVDVLYDQYGNYVTRHKYLHDLENFFNKSFLPALLDGCNCLININQ